MSVPMLTKHYLSRFLVAMVIFSVDLIIMNEDFKALSFLIIKITL